MVVAEEIHDGLLGVVRVKALARSFIWWPNLDRDLKDLAKRCERFRVKKEDQHESYHLTHGSTQRCLGRGCMLTSPNYREDSTC